MADDTQQDTADKPNPFGSRTGQQPPDGDKPPPPPADLGDDDSDEPPPDSRRPAKSGLEADLARERRQRQDLQRRLQQLEDRDKSELQKAVERAERAEAAAKDAARYRAAAKAGLTDPDLIERLRGDDDDALLADAKALAGKLTGRTGAQPDPDQGRGNGTRSGGPDMNAWMRQAAGRPT